MAGRLTRIRSVIQRILVSTDYTLLHDNGLRGCSFLRVAVDYLTGFPALDVIVNVDWSDGHNAMDNEYEMDSQSRDLSMVQYPRPWEIV